MTRAPLGVLLIVALALGVLGPARPVHGDTLGPLLPARTAEAGLAWRHLERTVGYTPYPSTRRETTLDQTDIAAFGRYGVTSNATFSFELSSAPGEVAFEDGDGALYLVGAALQLGIWSGEDYALSFGFHYASFFWRSDEPGTADFEEQLLEFTLLLQRPWIAGGVEGFVWAGPIASHLSLQSQLPSEDSYQGPDEMYGVLVGANALFVRHIGVEAQFLYVETAESHVALFYRF